MAALVCPQAVHSQAAVEAWTQHYNGPGNGADHATAVAVDTNGDLFVTGFSTGTGSSFDYATIKYSGTGAPLWTNRYNGPGNDSDSAYALAVDANGDVYVTGDSFSSSSSSDYATIKYSNAGVALWTNRYNGPGNGSDGAVAMALDSNGNVFVTGHSTSSGGSLDYATVKYSSTGVPLWTNRYNGPGNGTDQATAVAADSNGNAIVTGLSPGNNFWPDYATIKYSSAGVPVWTNRYNGPANADDEAFAVAADSSGNVFVTGYSSGSGSGYDYLTIKYSSAGVPLWTNRYNGFGGDDAAHAIAVDGSGNVLVTGYSSGAASGYDFLTIKYSGAGVPLWTNRYNGPDNTTDQATALAVDGNGNVFVTGFSFSSANGYEYATIAYSSTGAPLWTNRCNGPVDNPSYSKAALAVDRRGDVFMTGYSPGIGSSYDYIAIRYSIMLPSLTIARTSTNTVAVSWPSPSTGFGLQQNTNGLGSVNWSNVVTTPNDSGTIKTVIVKPPAGSSFYRLSSP